MKIERIKAILRSERFILVILPVAVLVGIAIWWNVFPYGEINSDGSQYHEAALNLKEKGAYCLNGSPTMMREPGYSFFLALIYRIFGVDLRLIKFFQLTLYIAAVYGIFYIGKRLFGLFAARCASLLSAGYPIFCIFSGAVLSETLAIFLAVSFCVLFFYSLDRQKIIWFSVSGLALGGLVMVKSAFLFSICFFFLFILFYFREKIAWKYAFIFVVFFSMLVVPWMLRNYVLFKRPSVASRSGLVLYLRSVKLEYNYTEIKNYVIGSFAGEYFVRRFIDSNYNYEQDGQGIARLKEFKKLNPGNGGDNNNYDLYDKYLAQEAKKIIREHPMKYLLYGLIEIHNLNSPIIYYDRHFSLFHNDIFRHTALKISVLVLLDLSWLIFIFFVVLGVLKMIRQKNKMAYVLVIMILSINIPIFFIQGLPRSLTPVLPFYFLIAFYYAEEIVKKFKVFRLVQVI